MPAKRLFDNYRSRRKGALIKVKTLAKRGDLSLLTSAPTRNPILPTRSQAGPRIPPILLEGDEPAAPPMTGPGQKFALGPPTPAGQFGPEEAALPAAYGTGRLLLAARDPHWLYAHWDLTPAQQQHYNALSADHHLVVRVFSGAPGTKREIHLQPESRHWFIHTDRADTRYVAELGYYRPGSRWKTIATSTPAVTPPDSVSDDQTVRFATIPAQVRLRQLAALAKQGVPADLPPPEAARERALAELVGLHLVRQDWGNSAEITELVHGNEEPNIQHPMGNCRTLNGEEGKRDGEHAVTVSARSAAGELRQAELKFSLQPLAFSL